MNKTISTLALTVFTGMSLAAGLPATDAEAHAKRLIHCDEKAKRNYQTVCPGRIVKKRKQTFPTPITHRSATRKFNFTSDPNVGSTEFGGGGDGRGGGGRGGGAGGNKSDIRLKRDIAVVGKLPNGLKLYRFKYLWSDIEWVGVMAQDVLEVAPEAVITGKDGFYRVRYDLLGTSMKTFEAWQAEMAEIHHLPQAA